MYETYPSEPFHLDLCPFLPRGWAMDLEKFAGDNVFRIHQVVGGPGSIGYGELAAIDYQTAMRPELIEQMPWLGDLHEQTIPMLLNLSGLGGLRGDPRAYGELTPITTGHGVTMNVYAPGRKGIEWHRDGADVFLNVILTTLTWTEATGGRFTIHDGSKVRHFAFDTPGVGLVALTGDIPHTVEPLKGLDPRLSVMFSYTNPERMDWREDNYDDHFYPGRTDG